MPWDRICYILKRISKSIFWVTLAFEWKLPKLPLDGCHWSRQTSAFSREVRGCDREVAEQLDDLILGSWSASRIQHKGHPVCKKLTEKARGPLFQPSYTNKNGQWFLLLHLHLYATHDFSNIWCSCLSCLQSFHCLGIVKWMLFLRTNPSLTVEDEAWASTCCNPLGVAVVQRSKSPWK